jgi:hypothetical protein
MTLPGAHGVHASSFVHPFKLRRIPGEEQRSSTMRKAPSQAKNRLAVAAAVTAAITIAAAAVDAAAAIGGF